MDAAMFAKDLSLGVHDFAARRSQRRVAFDKPCGVAVRHKTDLVAVGFVSHRSAEPLGMGGDLGLVPVSYSHLTPPTRGLVIVSVVAVFVVFGDGVPTPRRRLGPCGNRPVHPGPVDLA